MPTPLPYLPSNKNIGELFRKIASAAVPDKFTQDFLQKTIGLRGSNDRPLIPLLRNLGFLDQSNGPTPAYSFLKSKDKAGAAIAAGITRSYAPLFASDEAAFGLAGEKLKSLIAQVAGTDDDMTARIASTFTALVKNADFKTELPSKETDDKKSKNAEDDELDSEQPDDTDQRTRKKGLRAEFQYVFQIQLPSNGSEETYLNIFNALRKTFQ